MPRIEEEGKEPCQHTMLNRPKSASQIVAEARETVPELTVVQAKEELEQGHINLLLDVREPAEWEKGHISGVLLVPRGMLEWYADPTTPYAKPELTTQTRCSHHRHVCVGRTLDAGCRDPQEDGLHRRAEHGWRLQCMEQARVPYRVAEDRNTPFGQPACSGCGLRRQAESLQGGELLPVSREYGMGAERGIKNPPPWHRADRLKRRPASSGEQTIVEVRLG